ncbi:MAG: hypothetical protein IJ121_06735, partial [Eubacterium sp.]|nr:hypothetical protein [Eubacterium sp.]
SGGNAGTFFIYQEKGLEPEKKIAGILCSAILSDTLMFRSPTCTGRDRIAATSQRRIWMRSRQTRQRMIL